MADLTRDRPLRGNDDLWRMREWVLDNSTAQTIYKGQPMMLDANVDTVYARGFIGATTPATGDAILGIAASGATVATTDNETDNKLTIITSGLVGFQTASFTNADTGKTIYFSDSQVLTTTSASNLIIGKLSHVEDGYAYIMVNPDGVPQISA
jgi:predicted RecA/RadA family phage recombinase